MVHRPLAPGPLRLMCLRLVSQAVFNYLQARPRIQKYLQLCGPAASSQSAVIDYIQRFFPSNLRDLLLEFLTQLWYTKLLKMKQKTIDHERMSAGDPHHDHSTCGGTTAVREAQRVTNLMADLLGVGLTSTTRALRFGFANARSGPVDFSRPLEIIRERCASLRVLDLGFATDSPGPGQEGVASLDAAILSLTRQLALHNTLTTLRLLRCTPAVLQQISRLTRLASLEIVEAAGLRDTDLVSFSHGAVRHKLAVFRVKFWSEAEHLNHLCETQSPRKLRLGLAQHATGRLTLPNWAIFLLNCPNLTELTYFDPSQPRPFNPFLGLLTIIHESKKWWNLEIQNEGDLLDLVLETPQDLARLRFRWASLSIDMGNESLTGEESEAELAGYCEFLLSALPELVTLQLTLFPAPPTGSPEFPTMAALETGAGQQLLGRLTTLRFLASRPAHLPRLHQLLGHTPSLETLVLEHLQLPHLPPHQVVNTDMREVLSWLPATLTSLTVRGFHLAAGRLQQREGEGPTYPALRTLEIVFCGCSDPDLLHVSCLCPGLQHLTVVVSMVTLAPGGPPQPPSQGMAASHLHSLCHNTNLVSAVALVKVGEGWIQVEDREVVGELVLGSHSEHLRKLVLFPIRGICGGGLRSLVRAAKERNVCINIGIGNQRPVKTETNRRTGTDEFTLAGEDTQDYFNQFGDFLDKKISEFEGQFWNDPDWFYGGIWHEFGENEQFYH